MPTYTYECPECSGQSEQIGTIAEMLEWDDPHYVGVICPACQARMVHILLPPRRHVVFQAGFFEHVSEDGVHATNMSDLRRAAKEAGNYSVYAEDLGGLFRAKEGRWV